MRNFFLAVFLVAMVAATAVFGPSVICSGLAILGPVVIIDMWVDTHRTSNRVRRDAAEAKRLSEEAGKLRELRLLGEIKKKD